MMSHGQERLIQYWSDHKLYVRWNNRIPKEGYLLTGKCQYQGQSVVDTTLHWAYSLDCCKNKTIENDETPIVTHLHGGHTEDVCGGNPEFFYSLDFNVTGPQFKRSNLQV